MLFSTVDTFVLELCLNGNFLSVCQQSACDSLKQQIKNLSEQNSASQRQIENYKARLANQVFDCFIDISHCLTAFLNIVFLQSLLFTFLTFF